MLAFTAACGSSGATRPGDGQATPGGGTGSGGDGNGGESSNGSSGDALDAGTSSSAGGADAVDAAGPAPGAEVFDASASGAGGAGGAGGAAGGSGGAASNGGAAGSSGEGGSGAGGAGVLTVVDTFAPGGSACGLGYDPLQDVVWLYPCSGAELQGYLADGTPLQSIPIAGEAANDVDVDLVSAELEIAGVEVPEGTLCFINGETGTAEIHALDPEDGALLSTLATAHGASHVVGGAYHAGRGTFFSVEDRVPGGAVGNVVAEIDAETGAVVNQFSVSPSFDVNYGDLDVCQSTGNLLLVSSIETTIGEFSPTGTFLGEYALPAEVTSLAGIGVDDVTGEIWVTSNAGGVWHLDGLDCDTF